MINDSWCELITKCGELSQNEYYITKQGMELWYMIRDMNMVWNFDNRTCKGNVIGSLVSY